MFDKVPQTLEMLRSKGTVSPTAGCATLLITSIGKQLVFVTNNSTKSRADYKKKFDKLGIPAEVVREVLSHLQTRLTGN